MTVDKIILEGMEFYGRHGVRPEEQALGQPFIVDVELDLDLRPSGETDDPDRTVDYARVFGLTGSIVTGPPHRLIESVAESVAAAILETFREVAGVLVRVKKPRAPVPGHFTWMAVEIKRTRRPQ